MADEKKTKNFLYINYRYHERKPWLSISKSHFIKTTSIKHFFVIFIFYSLYIIVITHLLNVLKSMSCLQVVLFYNFIYNDLIYGPWIDYLSIWLFFFHVQAGELTYLGWNISYPEFSFREERCQKLMMLTILVIHVKHTLRKKRDKALIRIDSLNSTKRHDNKTTWNSQWLKTFLTNERRWTLSFCGHSMWD